MFRKYIKMGIILLCFIMICCYFSNISGFAYIQECSCLESSSEIVDNRNTFDMDSGTITLNTQTTGTFNYPYANLYFLFSSTERQFVELNYSGPEAQLKIYNYYYFNTNDYLFYSNQISYDQDIIYCDANQIYVLEFQSNTYNLGSFTVTPIKVTSTTLTNHEKFFMHINYDSTSSLGYRYDVEYKNLDLNNATTTTDYINTDGGTTGYLDLISNALNFGVSNDARRLVSNPSELQYSAVAFSSVSFKYINDVNTTMKYYRGTGTFVDETTVLSCAHLFYDEIDDAADPYNGSTSIVYNSYFYPGANSYNDSFNWYQNFGKYKGVETYLPISYVLFFDNGGLSPYESPYMRIGYDWSITLTENVTEGYYTHSYMRMYYFTGSINYQAQSAGYPALLECPSTEIGKYMHTMWSSYPLFNVVEDCANYNVLVSNEIIASQGNSGGPIYLYYTSVYNGQVIRHASIMGILDGITPSNKSRICRMRPIIINLYYEVSLL